MSVRDWTIYTARKLSTGILRGYVLGPSITSPGVGSSLLVEANILINHDGHACVTDFSLLMMIPDKANFVSAVSYIEGGTFR